MSLDISIVESVKIVKKVVPVEGSTGEEAKTIEVSEEVIEVNNYIEAVHEFDLPALKTPRFLHQAVVIKINNKWHLMILGGKKKVDDTAALNTVEVIQLEKYDISKATREETFTNEDKTEDTRTVDVSYKH